MVGPLLRSPSAKLTFLPSASLPAANTAEHQQLASTIISLLAECNALRDIAEARAWASHVTHTLVREGRQALARALGVPARSLSPLGSTSQFRRAASPSQVGGRGRFNQIRCSELDRPCLAEVCCLLALDRAPLPPARTTKTAADQLLAIAGVLGCVAIARLDDDFGRVAAWAVGELAKVLCEVNAQRVTAADVARKFAPRRRSTSRPRRCPETSWPEIIGPPLRIGENVLAHFPLQDGTRSVGVEDAHVVLVEGNHGLVRLAYVDDSVADVPLDWIELGPAGQRLMGSLGLASLAFSFERDEEISNDMQVTGRAIGGADVQNMDYCEVLGCELEAAEWHKTADYSLLRLIQVAAPPAEICVRMQDLYERPLGVGQPSLSAAIRIAMLTSPPRGQRACADAFNSLLSGGFVDAGVARVVANAILLSGCEHVPWSRQQMSMIKSSPALSEIQRAKLLALGALPDAWRPW